MKIWDKLREYYKIILIIAAVIIVLILVTRLFFLSSPEWRLEGLEFVF